jgi:hypothetical protein
MADRNQPARRIDAPEPCFLRLRLVRHGVWVPARIVSRMGILFAEISGATADVHDVWCSGDFITHDEYEAMMRNPEPDPYRVVHISTAGLAERVKQQDEADWWNTRPIR